VAAAGVKMTTNAHPQELDTVEAGIVASLPLQAENDQLRARAKRSAQTCDLILQLCIILLVAESISFAMTLQLLTTTLP
jgi:hypothetical protein